MIFFNQNYKKNMSQNLIIFLAVTAIILIILYNRIVALLQKRNQAFSDIDIQLKLRYDLIPNLVETVKGYMIHEKNVLENITNARTQAMNTKDIGERAQAEAALGSAITSLLAVAENYPNLKANENFIALQSELSDIENKVAAARRFFNNATGEFNTAIQQFPSVIIARIFGFHAEVFFEVSKQEKQQIEQPVQVKF
jgi:LemA protein